MDERIRLRLRTKKVREMKNPTILMNSIDFENFIKELETKIPDFEAKKDLTYEGVPVKAGNFIARGNVVIYDQVIINNPHQLITYTT
jgi:hypothetical protein